MPYNDNPSSSDLEFADQPIVDAPKPDVAWLRRRSWRHSWKKSWNEAPPRNKLLISIALACVSVVLFVYVVPAFLALISSFRHPAHKSKPVEGTHLPAQFFPEHNSQRVQFRHGPYRVPGMDENNGMVSYVALIPAPCSDCLITWWQAGLEYPDGTYANADTGMWLHHVVMRNMNATEKSLGCRKGWILASGNERTPIDLSLSGTSKTGYYIGPETTFGMSIEFMNMDMAPRDAVLTSTFEYISGHSPSDFSELTVLWLDVGGCNGSEVPAKAGQAFEYSSPAWTSNSEQKLVYVGSHLHDGGTSIVVRKNGKDFCESTASYGQSPGFISPPMDHEMHGMDDAMPGTHKHLKEIDRMHISNMSECKGIRSVAEGDDLTITAYYNTSKWNPMTNPDGSLEGVMGISILYFSEFD